MLEISGEILPIANNECNIFVQRYNTSVVVRGRTPRNIDSLEGKFEKLADTKKLIGDSSYQPDVGNAQNILRGTYQIK